MKLKRNLTFSNFCLKNLNLERKVKINVKLI